MDARDASVHSVPVGNGPMRIRLLEVHEWPRLIGLLPEDKIPSPLLSRCCIAEKDKEIVGFVFMQLIPHAEPAWVKSEERGKDLPGKMLDMLLENTLPLNGKGHVFTSVTNGSIGTLLEKVIVSRGFSPYQFRSFVFER